MKFIKLSLAALILLATSSFSYGQITYTIKQISYRKVKSNGTIEKAPFKEVNTETTANLFNNALTISGQLNIYFKFVRIINLQDGNGNTLPKYVALDKYGKECQIMVVDYGTYSKIAIQWMKTGDLWVLQTY